MARYGGGSEDFRGEEARLDSLRKRREELIVKEEAYQRELGVTEAADEKRATRERTRRRARVESTEVAERASRVSGVEARNTELDTEAIERNTRARQRNAAAQRQQQTNFSRALRGGRDPLFAQAAASGQTSQYGLRRELQIGSQRARNLQEALGAGLTPSTGAAASRPFTRVQAAMLDHEKAESQLAEATRNLTNTRKRKSATEDERLGAAQERQAATQRRDAARREVAAAQQAESAKKGETQAIQRETQRRGRSQELIRHPELFGQPAYGEAQATQAAARRVPRTGVQFERRPSGQPYAFSGAGGFDRHRAAGLAREADAAGNAAAASREYGNALTAEQRAAADALSAQSRAISQRQPGVLRATAQGTQQAAAGYGTLSQAMTRHGALQSEFITAAARGEVSLRQLGEQSIVTAGKFAGWTAAATALFGAASAIQRMGEGAISASSGVNTLRRVIDNVDADQAQVDFGKLSERFNVPIGTSVDAVYRMGQVFHDQADATKAAEAALFSFKTGEVDVATSTQNLIAIVNGFGLSADELTSVYDQINQAQNEFGIRIADTEAGLAKAAGTYRNAGGDLDYLLSLFVAIQKATGRSGTEIGTGIARAVQRIREPISQEKLASQGVEVDPQNFQKTLQRTLKAARRPGADLQELATGLFGNQYARLITPVLADQRRLQEAQRKTSQGASRGSAQKELNRVLDETREKIAAVGVGLERMGQALARSGALAPLGLMLEALNGVLDITTGIVNIFNELPAPIRTAVALLGEGYILLRLMQRFGATERFAGGPLGALAAPDQRLKVRATRGLRDARDYARDEAEGDARREYIGAQRAERERVRAAKVVAQRDRLVSGGLAPEYSPARIRVDAGVAAANERASVLARRAAELKEDTLASAEIAERADRQLNTVQQLRGDELRRHLARNNIAVPHEVGTPSLRGYGIGPGQAPATPQAGNFARVYQERTRRAAEAIRVSDRGLTRVLQGYSGGALARAVEGSGSRLARASAGARGATTGLASLPGRIRGAFGTILSGLGPLDAVLAAIPVGLLIKDKLDKQNAEADRAVALINRTPTNQRDARRQQRELEATSRRRDPYTRGFGRPQDQGLIPQAQRGIDAAANLFGYDTPWQREENRQKLAQQELENNQRILRQQARQRRRGGPVANLFPTEVRQNIRNNVSDLRRGLISMAQFRKELEERGVELNASARITNPRDRDRLKRELDLARRAGARVEDPTNFRARFRGANPKDLRAELGVTAERLGQVGRRTSDFDLSEISAEYRYLIARERDATSPEQLKQLAEDKKAFFDALSAASQREVEEGLLLARSEGDRTQAFSRGRRVLNTIVQEPRRALQAARARQQAIRDRIAQSRAGIDQAQAGVGGGLGAGRERIENISRLRGRIRADNQRLREAGKDTQEKEKEYRDAINRRRVDLAKLRDSEYQDRQEGRQVRLGLAQARTPNAARDASLAVSTAEQQVRDATRTYGTGSRQYRQALTGLLDARTQQAQALLAGVQADNNLLTARAGTDPAAQAQAAQQAAQNTLAFMQAHRGQFDINDIKNAEADLIKARQQREKAVVDDAKQVADLQGQLLVARSGDAIGAARAAQRAGRIALQAASTRVERLQALVDLANANNQLEEAIRDREAARFDLLSSRTTDPVQQAKIEVRRARGAIRGTKGADRLRARAEYNRARQGYNEAQITEREDSIDFELDMGKIERDEAIRRYEGLLSARGLTKQMRRDIARRIKQLREEGDESASGFDLDVGSIKLPTPYDVRKAWDPVRSAVKANHDTAIAARGATSTSNYRSNVAANITVIVNDKGAAGEVYRALDKVMNTNVNAELRSRGHRG